MTCHCTYCTAMTQSSNDNDHLARYVADLPTLAVRRAFLLAFRASHGESARRELMAGINRVADRRRRLA